MEDVWREKAIVIDIVYTRPSTHWTQFPFCFLRFLLFFNKNSTMKQGLIAANSHEIKNTSVM